MVRKKVKKSKDLSNLSYKERFKNQALTIRQLSGEFEQARNTAFEYWKENKVLKGEVDDLTAKCSQLEIKLNQETEFKKMYFNSLNVSVRQNERDEAEIDTLKKIANRRLFDITRLQKELDKMMKELEEAKKPWWKKVLRRG